MTFSSPSSLFKLPIILLKYFSFLEMHFTDLFIFSQKVWGGGGGPLSCGEAGMVQWLTVNWRFDCTTKAIC